LDIPTAKEHKILHMIYGEGKTIREVGPIVGLSFQRISQITKKYGYVGYAIPLSLYDEIQARPTNIDDQALLAKISNFINEAYTKGVFLRLDPID
jgi:hypothetical protein